MTLEEAKERAEQFFDWPSDKRETVTYTSALLFAMECVKEAGEYERGRAAGMESAAKIADVWASKTTDNVNRGRYMQIGEAIRKAAENKPA